MDRSKNGRWTGPIKKFRRLKVKCALKCQLFISNISFFTKAYIKNGTQQYMYTKS